MQYDLQDVPVDGVVMATRAHAAMMESKAPALHANGARRALVDAPDPPKLQQIIVNLLSNATKFTSPAAIVTVECESGQRRCPSA